MQRLRTTVGGPMLALALLTCSSSVALAADANEVLEACARMNDKRPNSCIAAEMDDGDIRGCTALVCFECPKGTNECHKVGRTGVRDLGVTEDLLELMRRSATIEQTPVEPSGAPVCTQFGKNCNFDCRRRQPWATAKYRECIRTCTRCNALCARGLARCRRALEAEPRVN